MSYEYFLRPEPREHLGPIIEKYDPLLQRTIKSRVARIGMVRNASAENRKTVRVYLEPFPHIRIHRAKELQGWYKGKYEKKGVRARPCYTEALLTEPYGGYCPVQCIHCYINSGIRGYRGTGLATVPLGYGEQVRKQLQKVRRASAGYITSFHDPFNVLEDWYGNSRACAQAFIDVGLPIFFLSRLVYPDWAVDALLKNPYSYAQKSMNTSSEEDWEKLSPNASSLQEHYDDIKRLHREGIYVSIQVNPVLPGITSFDEIRLLFKRLGAAGADHVIVKFVECAHSWAKTLVQRLEMRFGERAQSFSQLFTQNIGSEKTIDEVYRMRAHKVFGVWAKKYGLTYSVCYEYRYERDEEGEILNKTGVSIGPEVTTADQCHGKRVPCFTRDSSDETFVEVADCPPSGCLYCGEVPCGDETMGRATALRMKDLRRPL